MLWQGGFEALFTAPDLPPPLGKIGHGLQQRSHGVQLCVAVACDGLEGGALVGVGDASCTGDPGDVDEVAPAGVRLTAVESSDDLLGEDHVVGVSAQAERSAEQAREFLLGGSGPDWIAEVHVDVQGHACRGQGL